MAVVWSPVLTWTLHRRFAEVKHADGMALSASEIRRTSQDEILL
jgi:hypothetical protein